MAFSASLSTRFMRPGDVSMNKITSSFNRKPLVAKPAALSLLTPQPQLSSLVELEVEYSAGGSPPVTPRPSPAFDEDSSNPGWITYGVATTVIPGVPQGVQYCDPILGQMAAKDTTFNFLSNHEVNEDNIVALTGLALRLAMSVASITSPGTTCASVRSLSLFLFMERVITVSKRDYLGPQALSVMIDLMSYFSFSPSVSPVLLEQHRSLVATATQTLELCAAYEPSAIDVEMIVRGAEARARAPEVLGLKAVQSGATYNRRQLDLLKVTSDDDFSSRDASRLLTAYGKLERKYSSFAAHSQQSEYLAVAIENGIEMLTIKELEETAGAVSALEYVPARVKFSLLQFIARATVLRLSEGQVSTKAAGAILAVALHSANTLYRARAAEELLEEIYSLLGEQGLDAEVLKECT